MNSVNNFAGIGASGPPAAAGAGVVTANDAASADRFLKLLVAQMQNQDPLNPMDNAQVTSQMAQINTVTGIEKLNTSVQGLSGQFVQMQALQGASLVGHDVIVAGNRLTSDGNAGRQGLFDLSAPADKVQIEVLNGAGLVVDRVELGAQGTGRHGFDWLPGKGVDPALGERFRVVASSGAAAVSSVALTRDRVDAVSTGGDSLTLELRNAGSVPYDQVKAIN